MKSVLLLAAGAAVGTAVTTYGFLRISGDVIAKDLGRKLGDAVYKSMRATEERLFAPDKTTGVYTSFSR